MADEYFSRLSGSLSFPKNKITWKHSSSECNTHTYIHKSHAVPVLGFSDAVYTTRSAPTLRWKKAVASPRGKSTESLNILYYYTLYTLAVFIYRSPEKTTDEWRWRRKFLAQQYATGILTMYVHMYNNNTAKSKFLLVCIINTNRIHRQRVCACIREIRSAYTFFCR